MRFSGDKIKTECYLRRCVVHFKPHEGGCIRDQDRQNVPQIGARPYFDLVFGVVTLKNT